jgi:hypothetical protein
MAERASLYNFMARIGKSLSVICTKVGLFPPETVFLLFGALIAASSNAELVRSSGLTDGAVQSVSPQVFLLDVTQLEKSRAAIGSGDKSLAPVWSRLERDAQKALSQGPFTVVNKGALRIN